MLSYKVSSQTANPSPVDWNVIQRVQENIQQNKYGFVNIVRTDEPVTQAQEVLNQIEWASNLVVIGVGGSDLGARSIYQALSSNRPPRMKIHFYGNTTDPNAIDNLLANIDIGSTVFNIVSKSGTTLDTIAYYVYLKSILKAREENWQKHLIFTTDAEEGALQDEVNNNEQIAKLTIPNNVGGRFSVMSPVGLLPALAMGVDARAMVAGAAQVVDQFLAAAGRQQACPAIQIAADQMFNFQAGRIVNICWPYSSKLEEFGRWFRQLWAESLGKDGKGILPIHAYGPADQHSQLQFYTQGVPIASYMFVKLQDHGSSHIIKNVDLPGFEYLANKDFAQIINAEQLATAKALEEAGRFVSEIELDSLTPYSMGELFMTFQLAVTLIGELMGVDAFDQPGVERSKQLTKEFLQSAP